MVEERLKLAVFIDFDNIQIGVKDTLGKEFDVSLVLEVLKERGEVVTKVAYGDWNRAGEQSRQMTQHAVQMVQRNVTPRGDKNGADINLALDALEMAFTRHHISAFVIVGGDSDFIALVEKLKQYDKRVYVVGGRAFTSNILQKNCHEFIAYENLLKGPDGGRGARASRAQARAAAADTRPLAAAMSNVRRALKILAEREVAPQVGLLKSTLLQLDPTFSERDFGAGSFLEFVEKLHRARLAKLRRTDRGHLVELIEAKDEGEPRPLPTPVEAVAAPEVAEAATVEEPPPAGEAESAVTSAEAVARLKQALAEATEKAPSRPIYLRHISQMLRSLGKEYDVRRHGARALLDLLYQAQREGWLRLHRDRKGVLRIFPVTAAAVTEAATPQAETLPEAEVAAAGEFEPAEVDVAWDVPTPLEEIPAEDAEAPGSLQPTIVEEAAPTPPPAERRARKPRAAKAAAKSGPRRNSPRRKPKQPAPE